MNKYLDMLKSGKGPSGYTAKPAKPKNDGFAGFAVPQGDRFSKMRTTAPDPAGIPDDCVGALHDLDGGLFLPWGPHLSPDDVRKVRAELITIIEALSALECWASAYRDDVLTRAIRGPLADLLPNISYFRERLEAARAATSARAALEMRSWRFEDLANRRYCNNCDGSCFGTSKRCGKLRN